MHWIWLIIVGALVGALGRLIHPGSDPMGWIVTILIGIASLVVAGIIFSNGLLQFIVGIIVAVISWPSSAGSSESGDARSRPRRMGSRPGPRGSGREYLVA